jgi:predicted N-acyltransferase
VQVSFVQSIHQVEPDLWDALWPNYPFTRHAFLAALEDSGSTRAGSGWQPHHALIKHKGQLVGAVPLFWKSHSYGEYVFDWAWADAYQQHQLNYYPKLVCAIPFTPSTGPRVGLLPELTPKLKHSATEALHTALTNAVDERQGSGWHCLFPGAEDRDRLEKQPLIARYGYQFHWFNQGYTNFDDFLQRFSSRKRKNVKKERRKVEEAGLSLRTRHGHEISEAEWQRFYLLYQGTYVKRSGHYGYLGPSFFQRLGQALPDQVVLVSAHRPGNEDMVAAAFYLRDSTTLYGRYWGAVEEYDSLHFEACYYQGIDYAIAAKLRRFDPGAQGEHKIQRGFVPIKTCSFHWLADPRFAEAIADFCAREAQHVDHYVGDARTYLPYRTDVEVPPMDVLLSPADDLRDILRTPDAATCAPPIAAMRVPPIKVP